MIALTGLVVTISVIALPFLVDFESLSSRFMDIKPILSRLAIWAASINMMIQNPFFGIGLGRDSFHELLHEYLVNIGPISAHWATDLGLPHNEFFYIASATGVVGIVLYVSIFQHLFQMLRSTYKDPSSSQFEKDIALYMGGVFLCFISNSLFVDIGWFNYFFILMYFLFGIVATFNLKNKASEHRNRLGRLNLQHDLR